jgi:hypothetical protein
MKDIHRFAPPEVSVISSQSPTGGTVPYPSPGYGSALWVFLPFRVFFDIRIRLSGSSDPLFVFLHIQGFSNIKLSKNS